MAKRRIPWGNYLIEFLSVFLGILLAFSLNRWNENVKEDRSEEKILAEIKNGLELDLTDMEVNLMAHEWGVNSVHYFRDYINGVEVNLDSANPAFYYLLRDFVSLQNKTGYESLKSKGLELIKNDSLRTKIISLYDFQYEGLEKLEEQYSEMEFHRNYYLPITTILADHFVFDEDGNVSSLKIPVELNQKDYGSLMSFLLRIEVNRKYLVGYYTDTREKVQALIEEIETELSD